MKALIYGIIGGILSFVLLMFLVGIVSMNKGEEIIMAGTIVLSTVICSCTGIIIEKLNKSK
jgi:hypothetical protein